MFFIPKNVIKAASYCAATKDVRYYLNGVFLDVVGRKANVVSTDGYTLFAAKCDLDIVGETIEPFQIIIPIDAVKSAIKGKQTQLMVERLANNSYSIGGALFTPIDGTFQNWGRVVPQSVSGEPARFNFDLVTQATKAVHEFYGMSNMHPQMHMNGAQGAVVVGPGSDCVAVVMPCRMDEYEYGGFAAATSEQAEDTVTSETEEDIPA